MPNSCDAVPKKQTATKNDKNQLEIEHSFFERHKYDASIQSCYTCREKFRDKSESFFHCSDCAINIHKKCLNCTNNDCKTVEVASNEPEYEKQESIDCFSDDGLRKGFTRNPESKGVTSKQIKLMRISQKIKKNSDCFWKGNMAFTTNTHNKEVSTRLFHGFFDLC